MVVLKAARGASVDEVVRRNMLASALVAYSQGIPFFHAGDELLRSKSLDRDSYNSGDHFNALDWTMLRNNFGVGLPPAGKNKGNWEIMRPLLADPGLRPDPGRIAYTAVHFHGLLAVRRSTPLLRLRSAADVQRRLRFFNRPPAAFEPGVLVWRVLDGDSSPASASSLPKLDPAFRRVVVAVNATLREVSVADPELAEELSGRELAVHPVLAALGDEGVARARWDGAALSVPPLTAAVLVERR